MAAVPTDTGEIDISVSWNGATDVARWQVLAGANPDRLEAVVTAPKDGFETTLTIDPAQADYVAAQALDAAGTEHRAGLADRGRRHPQRRDREPPLQQLAHP
jgi:hypothetical protein